MEKRKGSNGVATGCHHHWMTYVSSAPGELASRTCFNCGVEQKEKAETLPRPVDWEELDGKQVWVRIIKGEIMLLAPDAIYRVSETAHQATSQSEKAAYTCMDCARRGQDCPHSSPPFPTGWEGEE